MFSLSLIYTRHVVWLYFGLRPHISRPDIFLLVMDVSLYCYFSFYVIPSHIIKELWQSRLAFGWNRCNGPHPRVVREWICVCLPIDSPPPPLQDVFLRVSAIEIALPVTITWGGLCRAVVVDKRGARRGERGRELLVSGGHKTSRVSRCYFLFAR